MALALVRDLRDHRAPVSEEDLAEFETDVLAGFVLARASAGLADSTIGNDTGQLELIRAWFGRPLWEMQPGVADAYFGRVLRDARPSTRTGRTAAMRVMSAGVNRAPACSGAAAVEPPEAVAGQG